MANIPQETLPTSCEAVNGIHCHYSNDAKNTNDSKENRYKSECEHSAFPFWFVFRVGFPSSVP